MKLLATLLLAPLLLPYSSVNAQTAAKAPTGTSAHVASARSAVHGCMKVPELSPKIPALPAGSSCAKPLYTISIVPDITLSDISPIASPTLRADLGITTAASFSLGYIDSKVGTGPLAVPHKWYTIQYTGYLADGTKFDSSYDPGHDALTFLQGPGPDHRRMVVPGMDTGIDGMRIGGKRRLFIPFQLGYPNGNPQAKIPPNSWLIFDIELVAQSDTPPAPKTSAMPPVPSSPASSAKPATPPVSGHTGLEQTAPIAPASTQPAGAVPPVQPATPPAATQPASQPPPAAKR